MKRVLKWPVPVDDHYHPIGPGPVVLVACQDGDPRVVFVWTEETDATKKRGGRPAKVYGTGQSIPEDESSLGSVVTPVGLVWHMFGATRW